MKRAYLGVLLAVVLPAIAVDAQGMRGEGSRGFGGGGGHGASVSRGSSGHGGTASGSRFGGRVGFTHGGNFRGFYHGFHGRGYGPGHYYRHGYGGVLLGYGYGFPYCASPYYCAPVYGYGVPVPDDTYGYDVPVDTSSSSASYTSPDGYVPAADSSAADSGASQGTSEYSDLGSSWGQDLRREVATWNQFVAYLRAYIVTAPASAQAGFREAFISAYRLNGATAYDKAAAEAAGIPPAPRPGPKIITLPPPPPPLRSGS